MLKGKINTVILPNEIAKTGIALKDRYFDLKGLSEYSLVNFHRPLDLYKVSWA